MKYLLALLVCGLCLYSTLCSESSNQAVDVGVIHTSGYKEFRPEYELGKENITDLALDIPDYASSKDLQELFDYMWIRLRIMLFIVSVYVLEMM